MGCLFKILDMGCLKKVEGLRFLIWVACIEVSLKKVGGTPKGSRHASSHFG